MPALSMANKKNEGIGLTGGEMVAILRLLSTSVALVTSLYTQAGGLCVSGIS